MASVLVSGSRSFTQLEPWAEARVRSMVFERIASLRREHGTLAIISGGAPGPDRWAKETAATLGLRCLTVPADWTQGKGAGFVRNRKMLDMEPDMVLAFWDGKSSGTRQTIEEAEKRGIPVEVIEP